MNRRDRRAARSSQQRGTEHALAPQTSLLFNDALRVHRDGNLRQAADLYSQILAVSPTHLGALQNLGAIAVDGNLHELAVDLYRRAIALDQAAPQYHRNIAIALLALGQTDEAIRHCETAIALRPDEAGAHMVLGEALETTNQIDEALNAYARAIMFDSGNAGANIKLGKLQLLKGQLTEAESSLGRALSLAPQNAIVHFYLGNLYSQQGQHQQAIDCYLRAIEIEPERLEAHTNMCAALIAQSNYAQAIAHYEQILAYKPDFVAGHCYLAAAHLTSGDPKRALECVLVSLRLAETPLGRSLFAAALLDLANTSYVAQPDEISDLMVRALSEAWDRPDRLMGHALNLVRADAEIAASIDRAAAAWPTRLSLSELFGATGFARASRHLVLHSMLVNGLIGSLRLERFLTNARYCMLQAADTATADARLDSEALGFYAAIARQCFINEYVYALSDVERSLAEKLRERLKSALFSRSQISPLWLTACAAYEPLHTLAPCELLLERSWPDGIDALLTQQVREPLEEFRLRETIPRLTPIENAVSVAVQEQYEQNPYPRWVKAPRRHSRISADEFVQRSLSLEKFRGFGKNGQIDLLTAGCGTGQQLLDVSQAIVGTSALAVDLSLSSLCYAKRKIEELGIANIEFGQADILQLATLGRNFDIIECGGVLHHLGDPEAGWRVLVSLLRPNGLMRIALYSERARDQIIAAQNLVEKSHIGRSADEIRSFRQELLANPNSELARAIIGSLDFFGTSTCRDLLFHAQEHRFTLPRIKAFLGANNLEFLGLEVSQSVRRQYIARFPEDSVVANLDNWHVFEQEHPGTFIGMYQFWVQKSAGAA
jgi:tetratricopeptide (TPR) repeat protein